MSFLLRLLFNKPFNSLVRIQYSSLIWLFIVLSWSSQHGLMSFQFMLYFFLIWILFVFLGYYLIASWNAWSNTHWIICRKQKMASLFCCSGTGRNAWSKGGILLLSCTRAIFCDISFINVFRNVWSMLLHYASTCKDFPPFPLVLLF